MYKGYRVVVVIPVGRRQTFSILIHYLYANRSFIDEVHLWRNERAQEDSTYFDSLCQTDPVFLKSVSSLGVGKGTNEAISSFWNPYRGLQGHPETILIRLDDDICYVAPDAFQELLDFRIGHRDYFLVSGNVINNALCSYVQAFRGWFPPNMFEYDVMGDNGWKSGELAECIHKDFLECIGADALHLWKYNQHIFVAKHFSINAIAVFAHDLPYVPGDEERFLTETYSASTRPRKVSAICGTALFAHYSFWPQYEYLQTTPILEQYRTLLS